MCDSDFIWHQKDSNEVSVTKMNKTKTEILNCVQVFLCICILKTHAEICGLFCCFFFKKSTFCHDTLIAQKSFFKKRIRFYVVCSLYFDSFPKIRLKKNVMYRLAYNITIYHNILELVYLHIVSPDSCRCPWCLYCCLFFIVICLYCRFFHSNFCRMWDRKKLIFDIFVCPGHLAKLTQKCTLTFFFF